MKPYFIASIIILSSVMAFSADKVIHRKWILHENKYSKSKGYRISCALGKGRSCINLEMDNCDIYLEATGGPDLPEGYLFDKVDIDWLYEDDSVITIDRVNPIDSISFEKRIVSYRVNYFALGKYWPYIYKISRKDFEFIKSIRDKKDLLISKYCESCRNWSGSKCPDK